MTQVSGQIPTTIGQLRFNSIINKTDDVEIKWCECPADVDCTIDAIEHIGITHALTYLVLFKDIPKADDLTQLVRWFNALRADFKPRRLIFYHPHLLLAPIDRIPVPQTAYNEATLTQLLRHTVVVGYKNRKLTPEEYAAYKQQYSLSDSNVQQIAASDPVCIFMGLVEGDVIQTERRGTNEVSVRLVSGP